MTDTAWQCLVGITIVAAIFGMIALLVWMDDRSGQREHELKMKGKK